MGDSKDGVEAFHAEFGHAEDWVGVGNQLATVDDQLHASSLEGIDDDESNGQGEEDLEQGNDKSWEQYVQAYCKKVKRQTLYEQQSLKPDHFFGKLWYDGPNFDQQERSLPRESKDHPDETKTDPSTSQVATNDEGRPCEESGQKGQEIKKGDAHDSGK
jgi:hypothetical protein